MGTSRLRLCVSDAGPLIHLAEIGALALLQICDEVLVLSAVWQETVGRGRVSEPSLAGSAAIKQRPVSDDRVGRFIQDHNLDSLHRGEQQCLFLCVENRIPVLLTDDLAARDATKRLGLTPVGSLGVVARAYRLGDVTLAEAERYIEDLQRVSTLFVTAALIDLVLDELRRFSP